VDAARDRLVSVRAASVAFDELHSAVVKAVEEVLVTVENLPTPTGINPVWIESQLEVCMVPSIFCVLLLTNVISVTYSFK